MVRELEFKNFSPTAKKGISKYSSLSLKGMRSYRELYETRTGKRASNINNKESFYSFVSRNKIRK